MVQRGLTGFYRASPNVNRCGTLQQIKVSAKIPRNLSLKRLDFNAPFAFNSAWAC